MYILFKMFHKTPTLLRLRLFPEVILKIVAFFPEDIQEIVAFFLSYFGLIGHFDLLKRFKHFYIIDIGHIVAS